MRGTRGLVALVLTAVLAGLIIPRGVAQPAFKLAPALALEAEDFTIEKGWKVVENGAGNYMVDIIGFNHISGERLLGIDAKNDSASAYADITIPETGPYRLWVRYEYPAFCETQFRIVLQQDNRTVLDRVMGKKDSLRLGLGDAVLKAQHDPSWGSEGLFVEPVTVPALKAGPARLYLKGIAQPQAPGVAANRNIDLLYLTRDTKDDWAKHYRRQNALYPILDAFRDTRGPRWEVRFTNRGPRPADFGIAHVYNRLPWFRSEAIGPRAVVPGATTDWIGLRDQDTTHFGMTSFTGGTGDFDVEVRPVGGSVERKLSGPGPHRLYLPPYPGKGARPIAPVEAIDAILAHLKHEPAIGKKPTEPLCYGGWMPLGLENDYGRKYAELYAALGFRSLHPAHSGPAVLANLKAAGVPPTKSWMVMGYRNPPTNANITRAKVDLSRSKLGPYLKWYDYGDEIAFSEWFGLLVQDDVARAKALDKPLRPEHIITGRWLAWLRANRPMVKLGDYWPETWGPFTVARMRPDSSAPTAAVCPRLYIDSLLFYEDAAIGYAATGAKLVREELGPDVLCGANYSCHPFYYPHSTMYIKWFRQGAADLGRHSDYFWQVGQAGPMVNGYIAEHFRAGMRDNPKAVLRQYTMPHAPGNTDANFLRSAFTHLAHGATMLDFFGVGLNESFTENHIDHRAHSRFRALRDVTHAVGLVEDLLPKARPLPSPVALLVSESTERWDLAGSAADRAGHDHFGPNFRKTRLHHHLERFGLWQALTFQGASPDLVLEEDITPKALEGRKLLVVVGDSLPEGLAPTLEKWVRDGGVVLATAGAGRFTPYREVNKALPALFGLAERRTEEKTTFIRPRQELPFLTALGTADTDAGEVPQLAVRERIRPAAGVTVRGRFKDDKSPALLERRLGKGRILYLAALPGVASLWSALQPPAVPDRGPGTHSVPTNFDPGVTALLAAVLKDASVRPEVVARPGLIDARLLKAPGGYVLPLANYNATVGQRVTLTVRVGVPIGKITSAYHGELAARNLSGGRTRITVPALGYGDVLRLEP